MESSIYYLLQLRTEALHIRITLYTVFQFLSHPNSFFKRRLQFIKNNLSLLLHEKEFKTGQLKKLKKQLCFKTRFQNYRIISLSCQNSVSESSMVFSPYRSISLDRYLSVFSKHYFVREVNLARDRLCRLLLLAIWLWDKKLRKCINIFVSYKEPFYD
jgi:hypothetical protein